MIPIGINMGVLYSYIYSKGNFFQIDSHLSVTTIRSVLGISFLENHNSMIEYQTKQLTVKVICYIITLVKKSGAVKEEK